MDEIKTLNGKYSARCMSCLGAVYRGWVDPAPPPLGCCEGHDDDISKCGAVYNALVGIVIGQDHIKRALTDRELFLLSALGDKAVSLMADIRAHKLPPNNTPREPSYDRSVQ